MNLVDTYQNAYGKETDIQINRQKARDASAMSKAQTEHIQASTDIQKQQLAQMQFNLEAIKHDWMTNKLQEAMYSLKNGSNVQLNNLMNNELFKPMFQQMQMGKIVDKSMIDPKTMEQAFNDAVSVMPLGGDADNFEKNPNRIVPMIGADGNLSFQDTAVWEAFVPNYEQYQDSQDRLFGRGQYSKEAMEANTKKQIVKDIQTQQTAANNPGLAQGIQATAAADSKLQQQQQQQQQLPISYDQLQGKTPEEMYSLFKEAGMVDRSYDGQRTLQDTQTGIAMEIANAASKGDMQTALALSQTLGMMSGSPINGKGDDISIGDQIKLDEHNTKVRTINDAKNLVTSATAATGDKDSGLAVANQKVQEALANQFGITIDAVPQLFNSIEGLKDVSNAIESDQVLRNTRDSQLSALLEKVGNDRLGGTLNQVLSISNLFNGGGLSNTKIKPNEAGLLDHFLNTKLSSTQDFTNWFVDKGNLSYLTGAIDSILANSQNGVAFVKQNGWNKRLAGGVVSALGDMGELLAALGAQLQSAATRVPGGQVAVAKQLAILKEKERDVKALHQFYSATKSIFGNDQYDKLAAISYTADGTPVYHEWGNNIPRTADNAKLLAKALDYAYVIKDGRKIPAKEAGYAVIDGAFTKDAGGAK